MEEKVCHYQLRRERDLYCTAASAEDRTAIGTLGLQRLAPTSKHRCGECNLPAGDYLCSHLIHPQVGAHVMEEAVGPRAVWAAECDIGQPSIREPGGCHAMGHGCWQRVVEASPAVMDLPSPLALLEELDFLDAAWRLLFGAKRRLLDLSTVSEPAGLALPCSDRPTFEARISDLADVLDRLAIPDDLLPEGLAVEQTTGSLNRLEQALKTRLDAGRLAPVENAIRRLRRVRDVRNAMQHSGAASRLPRALADLGLEASPYEWTKLWDELRRVAARSVAVIRAEVRHEADSREA
jgi:hypothetical protein